MRAIVTAIVFFKQRTVCIINVWGCAEILPNLLSASFKIIHTVDFANERRLNSAPENALFLPSSRLSHKYSYTGTSRTIHKADITENDYLKV